MTVDYNRRIYETLFRENDMSTMTSPNGVKTATCRIVYDFDSLWVQVTNVTSGNTVTIDVEGLDKESLFSPQENTLYDTLCGGLNNRHHGRRSTSSRRSTRTRGVMS